MPALKVYVDGEPVTLEVDERDDISAVGCELEAMKYPVNPAFLDVMVDGKKLEDEFTRVDFQATYKLISENH